MNKLKEKLIYLFEKIKLNKKLQIILFLFILLFILAIYFTINSTKNNKTETENLSDDYASYLEYKLENSLSSIKDIGNVNVTITLESGIEYVYAEECESKTTSSGTTTSTSLILVSGEPILIKEIYPKINGIVVVASGANNINVKLDILKAIQTVLDVSNDKITILS